MRRVVVAAAAALGGMLVAVPVAAAYSRADKAIIRDFMRHYRGGYKVVGVAHSDWTPDVGVWFVRTGAGSGYAVVGTAFYHHGRHVPPRGGDTYFLGGRPLYAVSFTGSGTYSNVESSPSGDGGTTTTTKSAQFQWTTGWSGKRALRLREDNYDSSQSSLWGTLSYSETGNNSCTGSLTNNRSATLELLVDRHDTWTFSFALGLPYGSSSDSNCNFAPPDANPAARYHPAAVPRNGADKGNQVYLPFTISPSAHRHDHTGPSADNPGYNADEDLAVSGTAHFTPIGIASY